MDHLITDQGFEDRRITAGNRAIVKEGPMTADLWLTETLELLKKRGFMNPLKECPELVNALLQCAATDCSAAFITRAIESLESSIEKLKEKK